ncbi:tetratricopeptide repeat-containing sulfotransferase family protein [Tahibacter caeni]|uniref:tetratricopeptide repeat-containing sulfotransferase family protein n=1 Tax=Tahibacter caeni TaxID=1453545 RepID=UPI0027D20350|nr:sulfotransferase [Tahibacter caeni]
MAEAAEHLAADRLPQTVAALTPVLQARAAHPEALRMLGIVLHKSGQYDDAVDAYRQALQSAPDDALLWNNLGSAQRARGDGEAAEDAFRRAVVLAPTLTAAWYNLGKMYKTQGRLELALPALERALQLDAGHVPARVTFGETLRSLGQVDAAVAAFEQAVRDEPTAGGAWYALADLKTYRFDAEQARRLQHLLGDATLTDEQRVFLGFAAAKALDDLGRYDEAYAALVRANRLKRAGFAGWDPDALARHYEQIGAAFAMPPPSTPLDPQLGAEAIFVVSLPRSGSTLTEQILAAHSQVDAAGEMPDLAQVIDAESARRGSLFPHWVADADAADWDRLGRDYLARAARWRGAAPRFTDKSLANWPLVGAIRRMLPAARIVNCRRDPVENCLSCFRQLFAQSHEYSYDLDDLARQWRSYDRLSRQWAEQFPEHFLDSRYEDLVREPERRIGELLAFCGLPFEAACREPHRVARSVRTASAAQVRQPIGAAHVRAARYPEAERRLRTALELPPHPTNGL